MLFKTLNGRTVDVPYRPYLIDWHPAREVSAPQALVKAFLHPYWRHDTVCEELRVPQTRMRLDLYNVSKSIVVEVSPKGSHGAYNPFFHRGSLNVYKAALKRELAKEKWCEMNGLIYVEIVQEDLDAGLTPELFHERFGVIL